jgi:hypothetical protein
MPHPLPKKLKTVPGAEPSLTVLLKSLRNPPLDISLSSQPLSTSILYLKEALSIQTSLPIAKIRLLYNKKPVPDSKILKDLVGEEEGASKIEFTVMVIGGAAALKEKEGAEEVEPKVVAPGEVSGKEILGTEEFWKDLRGFLLQRLNDEKETDRVWGLFQGAVN